MKFEIHSYLISIFESRSIAEVCSSLEKSITEIRNENFLAAYHEKYKSISSKNSEEIHFWFEILKSEPLINAEGNLKELFGLYEAAKRRIQEIESHIGNT